MLTAWSDKKECSLWLHNINGIAQYLSDEPIFSPSLVHVAETIYCKSKTWKCCLVIWQHSSIHSKLFMEWEPKVQIFSINYTSVSVQTVIFELPAHAS